jgi:hypothetical protein
MRLSLLYVILFLSTLQITSAQVQKGSVIVDSIYSKNLENSYGENPTSAVAVYLPSDYDKSKIRYSVIYFLHGFGRDHQFLEFTSGILDFAIGTRKIRPFIMVVSDQKTTYDGSFYSNSELFGNWEDFTSFDLVNYMDNNYRTIARMESRGITGHSMGGYGALKISMHHPEIFSSVYTLSPGALAIVREYGPNSNIYKELANMRTKEELSESYISKAIVAFAKSWSPNPNNPPFYCDIPFEYNGNELVTNQEVLEKWYANMPMYMLDEYIDNLKKLKAIKLDWGINAGDRFTIQCEMFSQRLENLGIKHFAEEYIGTHGNGIYTKEGRIPNQMLSFFDFYLDFKEDY